MAPEALQRWIMALNDLRLALGTALQISPDDDQEIGLDDPQGATRMLYQWLTAVQDGLVTHAMSS